MLRKIQQTCTKRVSAVVCTTQCRWATSKKTELDVAKIRERLKSLDEHRASNALVELYASRKLKTMGVRNALEVFDKPTFHSPIFCHSQLPVTLAKLISEIDHLPCGLHAMPSILSVRETLLSSFSKLVSCSIPTSPELESEFRNVLVEIEDVHSNRDIVQTMAVGIMELKNHLSRHKRALYELKQSSKRWAAIDVDEHDIMPYEELEDIQDPLNRCNHLIISYNFVSRMLLNVEPDGSRQEENRVGMVDLKMNLENVVKNAIDEAKMICTEHYGDCPDVRIISHVDKDLRFAFMSTTIRYIVIELMKNAFRASVESHGKKNDLGMMNMDDVPPVEVLIHLKESTSHACIRISDEGMGMTEEALQMAMSYSYTSVENPALEIRDNEVLRSENPNSLAGYGYGLPLSRVYATAFGGDLRIQSMEGYGTRVYYYIKL